MTRDKPVRLERRQFLRLAALGAGALVLPAYRQPAAPLPPAAPPTPVTDTTALARLEADLARAVATLRLPGLAVAIATPAGMTWSGGFGWADRARGQAMTADTVMNIASTSNTITAVALMQLWEAGRFGLDDDVEPHLPFPLRNPSYPAEAITFRHLLTHQSSLLGGEVDGASYACGDPAVAPGDRLAAHFAPGGSANRLANFAPWAPGERWAYSHLGFGLAGYLVEALSGQALADYCGERLFAPLGMAQTSYYLGDLAGAARATPYAEPGAADHLLAAGASPDETGRVPLCHYGFPSLPGSLAHTSASQLARFAAAMLNGGARVLQPATLERMLTSEVPGPYGPGTAQGLGWFALGSGERRVWGHAGGDAGVTAHVWLNRPAGVAVAALANAGADLLPIVQQLLEFAYGR